MATVKACSLPDDLLYDVDDGLVARPQIAEPYEAQMAADGVAGCA